MYLTQNSKKREMLSITPSNPPLQGEGFLIYLFFWGIYGMIFACLGRISPRGALRPFP